MKNKSLLKLQEYIQKGYISHINKITDKRKEVSLTQEDFWINKGLQTDASDRRGGDGIDLQQFMLTCLTRQSYEDLKKLAFNAVITPSVTYFILDRLDEKNEQYSAEKTQFEFIAGSLILETFSSRRGFQLLALEDPKIVKDLKRIKESYKRDFPEIDIEMHKWSFSRWNELMDLVGPS